MQSPCGDLHDSSLAFMGSTVAVVIFALLAIAEYVADLLPTTPRRTTPGPLVGRIVMGGLSGASFCASASRPVSVGAVLGGLGGLIEAFAGYEARARLVRLLESRTESSRCARTSSRLYWHGCWSRGNNRGCNGGQLLEEIPMQELKINGKTQRVDVPPDMPVLWVLRDVIG